MNRASSRASFAPLGSHVESIMIYSRIQGHPRPRSCFTGCFGNILDTLQRFFRHARSREASKPFIFENILLLFLLQTEVCFLFIVYF